MFFILKSPSEVEPATELPISEAVENHAYKGHEAIKAWPTWYSYINSRRLPLNTLPGVFKSLYKKIFSTSGFLFPVDPEHYLNSLTVCFSEFFLPYVCNFCFSLILKCPHGCLLFYLSVFHSALCVSFFCYYWSCALEILLNCLLRSVVQGLCALISSSYLNEKTFSSAEIMSLFKGGTPYFPEGFRWRDAAALNAPNNLITENTKGFISG